MSALILKNEYVSMFLFTVRAGGNPVNEQKTTVLNLLTNGKNR